LQEISIELGIYLKMIDLIFYVLDSSFI